MNEIARILDAARRAGQKTPLVGSVFSVTSRQLGSATSELLYLAVWSTLPFWLGGVVSYVVRDDSDRGFLTCIVTTFRNGELLVFSISALAPTLFAVLHDPEGASAFPHKLPLSTLSVLTIIVSGALFSILKTTVSKDLDFIFLVSILLSTLAWCLRFLSLLYHRLRLPTPNEQTLRASETDFVSAFQKQAENPGGGGAQ